MSYMFLIGCSQSKAIYTECLQSLIETTFNYLFFSLLVYTAPENVVSRAAITKHLQSLHGVDCAAAVCCPLL